MPGGLRAHQELTRHLPDAPEIEPIRIPAGADGGIIADPAGGMPTASVLEQGKARIGKLKVSTTQLRRQHGAARPVVIIDAVVLPAGIMKEGEEPHDELIARVLGEITSITSDTIPMLKAMNRLPTERKPPGQLVL